MKTTAREVEGQISGRGGGRDDDGGRGGRDGDGSGLLGPLPVGGRLLLPHLDDQGQGRADRRLLALLPRHLGVRLLAIVVPIVWRVPGRAERPPQECGWLFQVGKNAHSDLSSEGREGGNTGVAPLLLLWGPLCSPDI